MKSVQTINMVVGISIVLSMSGFAEQAVTQSSGNPIRLQTALMADKPLKQCFGLQVDSIGVSNVKLSWQAGDGEGRAIFISSDTVTDYPLPVDKTDYIANSHFGMGDSIGLWKCVYNGSETSVSIDMLTHATR